MIKVNRSGYYFAAILIGLAFGLATRDMPVGTLLAIVLVLVLAGRRRK